MRGWPTDGPSPDELARIHRWLQSLAPLAFIPRPLAGLDGRTFYERGGRLWEITPWLPGAPDRRGAFVLAHVRAGFAGLAALHRALADGQVEGQSPGLIARSLELERLLLGGFEQLERSLSPSVQDACDDAARRWLEVARKLAPAIREELRVAVARVVPLQPCMRDARPEHFLFEGDRLTGIVDFGAMRVETVAADLARLISEWIGPDRGARSEALAEYSAVRPLDESIVRLIPAFERSAALLGGAHWIQWHYVEGRSFENPDAVQHGLARAFERLTALIDPASSR